MAFKIDTTTLLYIVLVVGGVMSFVLGVISWVHTTAQLLPLPTWVPTIATLMSPVTVLTLIATRVFFPRSNDETTRNYRWRTVSVILNQISTIISTILATVALAYLFPDRILSCNLDQRWQVFFQSKNSHAIRSIQDGFRCCGLRSLHDRAWPFKDRDHGDNACELQLGYQRSCFAPWREHQLRTSWMVFAAVGFVFAAKIAFLQLSCHRMSWMSAQTTSRRPHYQRISTPGAQNEGENENEVSGDPRRTLLPQSHTEYRNDWNVD